MISGQLAQKRIVLLGAGHTHAHVLRHWGMVAGVPETELVCVSVFPYATYSGMLPAVVAGDLPRSAMEIDLVRLTKKVNCRLIVDDVTGLDRDRQELHFVSRPPLEYDLLSIGIGSLPSYDGVEIANGEHLVAIKPMQNFLDRLMGRLQQIESTRATIAVVGGGDAGAEIAGCLRARFQQPARLEGPLDQVFRKFVECEVSLISVDPPGTHLSSSARWRLQRRLAQLGVNSLNGQKVVGVDGRQIQLANGKMEEADVIVWATSARGPELFRKFDLELDSRGFLVVNSDLTTTRDHRIFAVGDSGSTQVKAAPKAGVYAVRQGPVLFENLTRRLQNRATIEFLPQSGFLKLLNVGNRKAIADYRGVSMAGSIPWRLKQRIDQRFMAMYQNYALMAVAAAEDRSASMNCLGCGGKIGSEVLKSVLETSQPPGNRNPDLLIGLDNPDDAAVLRWGQSLLAITTDHFAAPLDDPYAFGRMVVIHALSDLFAMGARPKAALANIEVPFGHPRGQRRMLAEVMAGVQMELQRHETSLVGGHTIEGPRLAAGITGIGKVEKGPIAKAGLQEGDRLVLTKPLGFGVGLAAHMQNQLCGEDYQLLMAEMLQSNFVALELLEKFQISGMTDVTGFGLLGHLCEMLKPTELSVELHVADVPMCRFTESLIAAGVASSLLPSNQAMASAFGIDFNSTDWKIAALFDPQTCGGLLFGIPESQVSPALDLLAAHGFSSAAAVGRVRARNESGLRVEFL